MLPQDNPLHAAAIGYAKRGWRVLPLDGKVAFTLHGSHDATTNPTIIDNWWTRYPFASVGIATGPESGLWVLDADGPIGLATLKSLALPKDTPFVWTGGGGVHAYFAWDDRVAQRGKFLPGLDTRGRGGYVVAPPSRHKSGKFYRWGRESDALPRAPEGLVLAVARHAPPKRSGPPRDCPAGGTDYGRAGLKALFDELAAVQKGGRDIRRNSIAFSAGRLAAGGHATVADAVECVVAACDRNGLIEEIGEAEVRKRTERAVEEGYHAGPRGPVPRPTQGATR